MNDQSGTNRRKLINYFIDPRSQLLMYLPYVATLIVFVITDQVIVHHALDEISRLSPDPNPQSLEALTTTFQSLVRTSVIGLILAATLGFVLVTIVSHRLLGPLYNITRFVRRLREGAYHGKLILRKGDRLTELADDLNLIGERMVASGAVRNEERA